MSFESETEAMVGLIPLTVTAGLVSQIAGNMFQNMGQQQQQVRQQPKKKKKADIYSRDWAGDFSNIGW